MIDLTTNQPDCSKVVHIYIELQPCSNRVGHQLRKAKRLKLLWQFVNIHTSCLQNAHSANVAANDDDDPKVSSVEEQLQAENKKQKNNRGIRVKRYG